MNAQASTIGRKRQDTPENIELLLRLISEGHFYKDACWALGISYRTFCRWREGNPQFCHDIKKARARGIIVHVTRIYKAGDTDWRAAAWWLERVARDRCSRKQPRMPKCTEIILGFKPESAFIHSVDDKGFRRPTRPRKRI